MEQYTFRLNPSNQTWEQVMGAGPIEDKVLASQNNGDTSKNPAPHHSDEYFGTEEASAVPPNVARAQAGLPPFKPAVSPEETLIKDQHLFIEALLDFIHDPSAVPQFAGAQEQYIRASMKYAQAKLDQK